jgi:hypothetical protein
MKLLVACHDAGGAEIVAAWLARRRGEDELRTVLSGPAVRIFAHRLGDAIERLPELPPLDGLDLVLCGSSATSDLERRAVRAARAAGVPSAVWLDHWVFYRERFVLDGALVAPDEVWVTDADAARRAAQAVPGARIVVKGNPYLEEAAAEIRALSEPHGGGERILYVTEPTAEAALLDTGDPMGWGYEERDVLARFLERLARAPVPPAAVRVRPHPAEPRGKYAATLAAFAGRLPVALSEGGSLAGDCAWADTVAGCETMALVVALAAGRRVISVIPPGGRPLSLPFEAIERAR